MEEFGVEEARERLGRAGAAPLVCDRDRRVQGVALAVTGLAVALLLPLSPLVRGREPWSELSVLAYLALVLGAGTWQRRAARTMPRHARRTERVMLAVTVVLGLAGVTAVNVRPEVWVYLLAVLVAALPSLVLGVLVARGATPFASERWGAPGRAVGWGLLGLALLGLVALAVTAAR